MNLEQQLRDDLHQTVPPAGLLPPAGLADTVLDHLRRQRRSRQRMVLAAALATLVLAAGVPVGVAQVSGAGDPDSAVTEAGRPSSLPFPTPGGGPQAIHVYLTDQPAHRTFLLDIATGEYREFPFEFAALSPDLTRVAVVTRDGPGVADRAALLADGVSAIRRIDLPDAGFPAWSPDGAALLFTSVDRSGEPVGGSTGTDSASFVAHRYDVVTGTITDTPIEVEILASSVGWAGDSTRYLALLPGESGIDTVEPGALQYIEPDGTPGERIEIEGGRVGGAESYSPSGEHVTVDSSGIMSDRPVPSKVVDVETDEVVMQLPGDRAMPVGWYDDATVVQLVRDPTGEGTLERVDIHTGEVTGRIGLPGLPPATAIQLGSSTGLTGPAEAYGF